MTLIEQAEEIAKNGYDHIKSCQVECLLTGQGCGMGAMMDYKDSKFVARAFLDGINYAKNIVRMTE
jgi:hypothetical protein